MASQTTYEAFQNLRKALQNFIGVVAQEFFKTWRGGDRNLGKLYAITVRQSEDDDKFYWELSYDGEIVRGFKGWNDYDDAISEANQSRREIKRLNS